MKDEALLMKLRDTEHTQLVAEMRRRIAELELQVCLISYHLQRTSSNYLHIVDNFGISWKKLSLVAVWTLSESCYY